jgi:ketosteroid isomerase-like protein
MSDVDVVRRIYGYMASGDIARLFELVDPAVVVTQDPAVPWGGRFEGHDGLATFALGLRSHIDSRVEVESIFEADGEVIQAGRTRGVVAANGASFDIAEVHRWTVVDGKAVAAHFSIDVPAMLDALAAAPEACADCGLEWTSVVVDQVGDRIATGVDQLAALLRSLPDELLAQRPAEGVWSPLEYGGHVRDVLFHLRDRIAISLAEDVATFKPLYRDQRVDAGMYRGDTPAVVADELEVAGALFGRTFGELDGAQLGRLCVYGYPTESLRTLRWLGQQAVHEVEHHGGDVVGIVSGT